MLFTSSNSLIRCSISTERVDFLDPSAGRTGTGAFFPAADVTFSLLSSDSSAPDLAAGEAGIVLRRFFSPTGAVPRGLEDEARVRGRAGVVAGVRALIGVAATFLALLGLVVVCRLDVAEGCTVVRLAGVAVTDLVVPVRSDEVDGASDMRFGFAVMPSLLFSSPEGFSSMVLPESLFLWAVIEEVETVVAGLRAVDAVVIGLAGGLLNELPTTGLVAVDVVDGREAVESLGAADLVTGFATGCGVFALRVVVSSFLSMVGLTG